MIPLKGALDNAGGCSIPLTLIVLGGWFWDGETKPKSKSTDGEEVKDPQGKTKSKGKGIEKRHRHRNGTTPTLGQTLPHASHENTTLRPKLHVTPYSRDSSTGSLSSMIGSFGDVLMARIHPRGSTRRAKRRVRGTILANRDDVEPGVLATHTESDHENAENGLGRTSRSHPAARLSPVPASPTSPPTRGTNPPGETLTIVVTLLARMVVVPLVVAPMMVLVSRLGWGGQVFEEYVSPSPCCVRDTECVVAPYSSYRACC